MKQAQRAKVQLRFVSLCEGFVHLNLDPTDYETSSSGGQIKRWSGFQGTSEGCVATMSETTRAEKRVAVDSSPLGNHLAEALTAACEKGVLVVAQRLRQQGAVWPPVLRGRLGQRWSAELLAWARAEGCTAPE
jgi:hypothetical protein